MDHHERARELHHTPTPHYNCCQSVLLPFGEELGRDRQTLFQVGAPFGSGMRRGSVCGACVGGLMALGLLGIQGPAVAEFQRRFQARAGALDCAVLLRAAQERGEERKAHCDRMVDLAVTLVEELSAEQGENNP